MLQQDTCDRDAALKRMCLKVGLVLLVSALRKGAICVGLFSDTVTFITLVLSTGVGYRSSLRN